MTLRRCLRLAAAVGALVLAVPVHAATRICVFDFLGTSGDAFNLTRDFVVAMQREGVELELKGYNDEGQALNAYTSGLCDGLLATGFRTRQFNGVAAATDSLGATTIVRNGNVDIAGTYEVLRKLIQTFAAASPQVARLMVQGEHEVAGMAPAGAAYPFMVDRKINSVEALAGKRIIALAYDPAQAAMIQRIKGIPVPATLSDFHLKFNSGQVDMLAAPTMAYLPLELHKGLGSKGAITRFPLLVVTYQMVIRHSKFPPGFGAQARTFWAAQFDRVMQLIRRADASVPPQAWMDLEPQDNVRYTQLLRESRMQLTQQGMYDKRGLKILKRIRCHVNPADAECGTRQEED